jgi:CHAT domain-containing protein
MSVEDARSFCGDDRAFLEYMLWDPANTADGLGINSYCIVLSKEGVSVARLDHTFDYQGAVQKLRRLSSARFSRPDSYEIPNNDLYSQLIKPALPHIPANVTYISIVPDGSLIALPFDILRETPETPDFGESYRLSFSLSIAVSALAAAGGQTALEPILAFGGTEYNSVDQTTVTRDISITEGTGPGIKLTNHRWPYLPGSKIEVENIAAMGYNATVITGVNVLESRLKELSLSGELRKYQVLHFAISNYFDDFDPALSALIFSEAEGGFPESSEDGYLTSAEIALLDLNANIAILSSCQSGLGGMDNMTGFVYSFMTAGAARVISTLWEIDDRATVEFMDSLYKKVYQEGKNFSDALWEVKNDFKQSPQYRRPVYWAGFTLYE